MRQSKYFIVFRKFFVGGISLVSLVCQQDVYGDKYDSSESKYSMKNDFNSDSDKTLLARLLYGECRGESLEVKRAVVDSVLNRTGKRKWWGNTLREVILKEGQYSCFNKGDKNFEKIKNPLKYEDVKVWGECLYVAEEALSKDNKDDSKGATHYYDSSVKEPKWAKNKKPVLVLKKKKGGTVRFYRLER